MPSIDDVYDNNDELKRLAQILEPRYQRMLLAVHQAIRLAFGLTVDQFRLSDSATNLILVAGAQRVVRINETTRQQIVEQLRVGQELGLSTWEIAHGVPKLGYRGIDGLYMETWKGRPDMIARTELQWSQVASATNRYEATGLVDKVTIVDGDDDKPCNVRNGTTVDLATHPQLAHPNCTLGLIPVLRDGVTLPARSPTERPRPLPAPKPQKWGEWDSVEQAQAAATARYPHIHFGLEGMHIDTVNPVLKQFAKLSDDYPYANQALRYLGTYVAQPAPHTVDTWEDNTYAHATGFGDQPRIALNPHWFGDPTKLGLQLNRDGKSGFHPKGCDEPASILTHEFGHVVQHRLLQMNKTAAIPFVSGTSGNGLISDTVNNWSHGEKPTKALSVYSQKDWQEAWAEGFAAQYHSPSSVKQLAYVRRQRTLLKALEPENWTTEYEVVDIHTPRELRSERLHFIHQWFARFTR